MVAFKDELLARLEVLHPEPGGLLVVHLPVETCYDADSMLYGLQEVLDRFDISGAFLLPPGSHVESLTRDEKRRLVKRWLDEERFASRSERA